MPKNDALQLVWLRNDLRVQDNPALWHASEQGPVVVVCWLTPDQWRRHRMAPCRVDFVLRSLMELRRDLGELGIPLVVAQVPDFEAVPDALLDQCRRLGATGVSWNDEYPVDERARDDTAEALLAEHGIAVSRHHDRVIAPPGSVLKADGEPYKVFTPFSKTWLSLVEAGLPDLLPPPARQPWPRAVSRSDCGDLPAQLPGLHSDIDPRQWPEGECEARDRLARFCDQSLVSYHSRRDLPAEAGTSQLSPYLAVGAISPQQCLLAAWGRGGEGPRTWINELIWRDFYQHLLVAFPRVSRHKPFQPDTDRVPWRDADGEAASDFAAWCEGRTGVPLVDAGMRELLSTGWMHNRVRMVTAMFLSKNLLIDWRRGEAFFMAHLIDGDLAANNGGWQWSASTGTDAAPYFRIFNPFSQGSRFDPEAHYIKRHVPELAALPANAIHDSAKLARLKPSAYPDPVVDVGQSRRVAIEAFRSLS